MRNLSKKQFGEPKIVHEKNGFEEYVHLHNHADEPLSSVHYNDWGSEIYVRFLQSHQEGKGHATKVMDALYNKHPDKVINWDKTSAPESTHLANKFSEKYGRTRFRPWKEGAIPGFNYGDYYGDEKPKGNK